MNFKVIDNDIKFSDEFIELNKIRIQFLELAVESVSEFTEKYKAKFKGLEELSNQGEEVAEEFLKSYILKAIEVIKEYNVDLIEVNTFGEKYYYGKYCTWFKDFDKINEEYLLSKDVNFDIKEFKKNKKDKRKGWVVCKGKELKKLKSKIDSSSLKIDSKLIDNKNFVEMKEIITDDNEEKKESNMNYEKVLNRLILSMEQSIFNIHFAVLDILNENGIKKVAFYSDFVKIDKANELLGKLVSKEIDSADNNEDIKIKEVIELYPYNEETYKLLLMKFGDKEDEIQELGKFLGYNNIREYKNELVNKYYEELPAESKEEVEDSKKKLIDYAENLNVKEYSKFIEELESKVKVDALDEIMDKYYALEKKDKVKVCAVATLICVVIAYLIATVHFNDRFYYGTIIDNVEVVGRNVDDVTEELVANVADYNLELQLIDDEKIDIKASDVDLKYDLKEEVKKIKEEQNPFKWGWGIFNKSEYSLTEGVIYNEEKLESIINELPCFNNEKVVAPKNAELQYKNGKYEIIKEVEGNTVIVDKLKESIVNAIKHKDKTLYLDKAEVYEKPKYTSESEVVTKAKSEFDKYIATIVDYKVDGNKEVINAEIINTWLEVDEDFNIKFNEEEIKRYLDTLGAKYDKADNIREFGGKKFTTSKEITTIDKKAEIPELIELVKAGQASEKEAKFTTTTVGDNIINTFVEIDITKQHIWFYKNGELLTDGAVVTGNISKGHNTRVGTFKLYAKERNRRLVGDDYDVPVDFWMPFDGGIGMHDARWRGQFGGEIYKTNGSHGCVNSVYDVAKTIYNNIKIGDYVIVHY